MRYVKYVSLDPTRNPPHERKVLMYPPPPLTQEKMTHAKQRLQAILWKQLYNTEVTKV